MAVAHTGVEQRIAREQRWLVGVRQQADMAHGMAGRIQRLKLDRSSDTDDVACRQPPVDATDLSGRLRMSQQPGSGCCDHCPIAADVIAVLMGVKDLGNLPAMFAGTCQALFMVERVDSQGLARFRAGDQIIKIAIGVTGPDLFDDHRLDLILRSFSLG